MPPFKEWVDVVAMGLDARLEAPVKMSMAKTAGCLVAWRNAGMEGRDAMLAAREHAGKVALRKFASCRLRYSLKGYKTHKT